MSSRPPSPLTALLAPPSPTAGAGGQARPGAARPCAGRTPATGPGRRGRCAGRRRCACPTRGSPWPRASRARVGRLARQAAAARRPQRRGWPGPAGRAAAGRGTRWRSASGSPAIAVASTRAPMRSAHREQLALLEREEVGEAEAADLRRACRSASSSFQRMMDSTSGFTSRTSSVRLGLPSSARTASARSDRQRREHHLDQRGRSLLQHRGQPPGVGRRQLPPPLGDQALDLPDQHRDALVAGDLSRARARCLSSSSSSTGEVTRTPAPPPCCRRTAKSAAASSVASTAT